MAQLWAVFLAVTSLAIGMLGVLGVWLCFLFQAVVRGAPPEPPLEEEATAAGDDMIGLSPAELQNLGGIGIATEAGSGEEADPCAICLDDIKAGDAVRTMPGCRRAFHKHCIDQWLTIAPRCPVCNVNVAALLTRPFSPPAKAFLDS